MIRFWPMFWDLADTIFNLSKCGPNLNTAECCTVQIPGKRFHIVQDSDSKYWKNALGYITLHYTHYTTANTTATALRYLQYTPVTAPLHYSYNYIISTPHYIQQLWVRGQLQPLQPPSNHVSVHQWIRSAIHASQQQASPVVSFLELPPQPCAVLLAIVNNSGQSWLNWEVEVNSWGMNGFHCYVEWSTWPHAAIWLMPGVSKRRFRMGKATNPPKNKNQFTNTLKRTYFSISFAGAATAKTIKFIWNGPGNVKWGAKVKKHPMIFSRLRSVFAQFTRGDAHSLACWSDVTGCPSTSGLPGIQDIWHMEVSLNEGT